ncbi:MAG: hypothetical protein ABI045_04610 [Flavobacteriales bacterium]
MRRYSRGLVLIGNGLALLVNVEAITTAEEITEFSTQMDLSSVHSDRVLYKLGGGAHAYLQEGKVKEVLMILFQPEYGVVDVV